MKKYLGYLFLLSLLIFGYSVNISSAFENKLDANKIGLLKTKNLQNILEKTFYLFGLDKENAIPFYLKNFINWDHEMIYDPNYYAEIENIYLFDNKNLLKNIHLDLTQNYEEKLHFKKSSNIFLKENEIKDFLQSITKDINQKSTDARFRIDKDTKKITILKKSQVGTELQVDESFDKIRKNLVESLENSYILLSVSEITPEINSQEIKDYEIKELVGSGKSDFTGSSSTRIHNIKTAAKRFDGLVLKPKDEFSFTTILGEVDESTGYKEELVIKKNQTVPEFGGGICQISTTMFRVALNSGMEITERHNHSYPVHYYDPPGTDATVYVPQPDLKFKNNTNGYLLIQTDIDEENKKFYIDFYSKEDLFDVEIIGPEIIERTSEGKLRTTLKQIVKDKKTGKEIFQNVFNSFYDNPANYPSPDDIILEKPKDWSNKQWDEHYAKFGAIIEEMKKAN
jgi:vancomycin resistance protein YoaR